MLCLLPQRRPCQIFIESLLFSTCVLLFCLFGSGHLIRNLLVGDLGNIGDSIPNNTKPPRGKLARGDRCPPPGHGRACALRKFDLGPRGPQRPRLGAEGRLRRGWGAPRNGVDRQTGRPPVAQKKRGCELCSKLILGSMKV